MTSFSNPIVGVTDAQDHIDAIRDELGLPDTTTMSCKPQDMDRTQIETLDIDPDLTNPQMDELLLMHPELVGTEV